MDDRSQERFIRIGGRGSGKTVARIELEFGARIDELEQVAFILSGEGNRKQRRAFAARNRRKDK